MKNLSLLCFSLLFSIFTWGVNSITPALQKEMNARSSEDKIRINIRLTNQYDTDALYQKSRIFSSANERRSFVVAELKSFSKESQASLISFLEAGKTVSAVSDINALWIANVINCYATKEVIAQLDERDDVAWIDYDEIRNLIPPVKPGEEILPQDNTKLNTWNITKVNAQLVWEQGYTGQGAIVAVIDSGVNYNHQDLADHMWTHPDYPFHGYNFANNNNNPMDGHSHGTHCAGTVAGDGTAGTSTGMAPDATIMALKVLADDGDGSESNVWAAIQFAVEHGANIFSMSLGWLHDWTPDRVTWRTTMVNALSAGLIGSVAAGNEGDQQYSYPIPDNVRTPGDCPPPWLHPDQTTTGGISAVVCVGSVTESNELSYFSAIGPVTWQETLVYGDYPYSPGMGLIRPDIVAPGSDITSTSNTNNTGYTVKSGTSMATPCVAGLMALAVSKNINITPEEISMLLETTAIPYAATKSNTYGSGRVDALALINATPFPGPQYVSHTINDPYGNNNGIINPGETISISLELSNLSDEDYLGVNVVVRSQSPYLTCIDSVAVYDNIPALGSFNYEDAFSFLVSDSIPDRLPLEFLITSNTGEIESEISFYDESHAPDVVFSEVIIEDPEGNNNGRIDPGENISIVFPYTNIGQMEAQAGTITIEALQPQMLFENNQQNVAPLAVNATGQVSFDATVHSTTPMGSAIFLKLTHQYGGYNNVILYRVKVGEIVEDFESGNFSLFDWGFSGSQPWILTNQSDEVYQGDFSSKSGVITNNTFSQMFMAYEVMSDDTISFRRKVSSEAGADVLKFYIDNEVVAQWSGEQDWERFEFPVAAGSRTFRWVYQKNSANASGSDAAWVDFIQLPPQLSITAFAGYDTEICADGLVELNGYVGNASDFYWASSGDGTFTDENNLETVYTPGPQDIIEGDVHLSLNVPGNQTFLATDTMFVGFLPLPVVDLGNDTTICQDDYIILDAGEGHTSYLWSNGSTDRFLTVDYSFYNEMTVEVSVIVTSENSCQETDTVFVDFVICDGVDENNPDNLKPYFWPNPAKDEINISGFNIKQIEIIDIRGCVWLSKVVEKSDDNLFKLNINSLPQGIFFIRLSSDGQSHVLKMIRE